MREVQSEKVLDAIYPAAIFQSVLAFLENIIYGVEKK
jgi:hypothetical protein